MEDERPSRPSLVTGGRAGTEPDARVAAVLEVLGGRSTAEVAQRWSVDTGVLHRWVRAFVDAGSAQVTNTPDPDAARQRDRFLAAFAHELRTPLTVARGWVAMLAEGGLPPAVLERTVGRLEDSLERLSERVVDVELMAAASLGLLRLSPAPTTVGELVTGLPGLEDSDVGGAALALTVDHDLFRRVLRDLWGAAGSPPQPRRLAVAATVVAPWVEVRVLRDADPVEHDVLQALFEPFDLNHDGTGVTIGLYLARALVIAHGGTLGVDQDEDGAAFWVRVPVHAGGERLEA